MGLIAFFGGPAVVRVYLVLLLLNTADGTLSTLAAAYARSLGFPLSTVGVVVGAFAVGAFLSRWPAGRLADGRAAHNWQRLAMLAFAGSLLLYPLMNDATLFALLRGVQGVAIGISTTLNLAAFFAHSAGSARARSTSIYTAFMSGGYALGNFASGALADRFGYSAAFAVAAVCPLAAILLVRPGASEPPRTAAPSTGAWRLLLGNAQVRSIPLLALAVGMLHQTLTTLFPLYVLSAGLSLTVAGTGRGLQSLTNSFVRPFGGLMVRRFSVLALGTFGVGATALVMAVLPLLFTPILLYVAMVLIGLTRACAVFSNTMNTSDVAEQGLLKRGTASALLSAGNDVASIAAPVVAGWTAGSLGIGPALQVLPLFWGTLGVAALLVGRTQRQHALPVQP